MTDRSISAIGFRLTLYSASDAMRVNHRDELASILQDAADQIARCGAQQDLVMRLFDSEGCAVGRMALTVTTEEVHGIKEDDDVYEG